jgi:hypothetical protein
MATLTITRTVECAAQNHVTLSVTGDVTHTYNGTMVDLTGPITDDEKDAFIKLLIRFAKIGRTGAQVRTALTNGVTVTI